MDVKNVEGHYYEKNKYDGCYVFYYGVPLTDAKTNISDIRKCDIVCREAYGWLGDRDCFVGIRYGETSQMWHRLSVYNSGKPIQIFNNVVEQKAKEHFMKLYPNETNHGSVAVPIGERTHYMYGSLVVGSFIQDDEDENEDENDDKNMIENFISHTLSSLHDVSFRGEIIATVDCCPHGDWKSCADAFNVLTRTYDPIKTKQTICFLPRMCNCCT